MAGYSYLRPRRSVTLTVLLGVLLVYSVLPLGFWLVSFVGSLLILTYALLRRPVDTVLIVGNIFGTVVYARNIVLMRREQRPAAVAKA